MELFSIHSAPRSGSTWLQGILEAHPSVTTRFQPLFSYRFKNAINQDSSEDDFEKFVEELVETDDPFVNSKSEFHINNGSIMPEYEKKRVTTLVMKNVHHHYLIEKFINWDTKIIGLIREPCGVVNSLISTPSEYKKEWLGTDEWLTGKLKNIDDHHFWGYLKWKEVKGILLELKKRYPERVHIVDYSRIKEDLPTLMRFMGLTVHPNQIKFINKSSTLSIDKPYSIYSPKKKPDLPQHIREFIENDMVENG